MPRARCVIGGSGAAPGDEWPAARARPSKAGLGAAHARRCAHRPGGLDPTPRPHRWKKRGLPAFSRLAVQPGTCGGRVDRGRARLRRAAVRAVHCRPDAGAASILWPRPVRALGPLPTPPPGRMAPVSCEGASGQHSAPRPHPRHVLPAAGLAQPARARAPPPRSSLRGRWLGRVRSTWGAAAGWVAAKEPERDMAGLWRPDGARECQLSAMSSAGGADRGASWGGLVRPMRWPKAEAGGCRAPFSHRQPAASTLSSISQSNAPKTGECRPHVVVLSPCAGLPPLHCPLWLGPGPLLLRLQTTQSAKSRRRAAPAQNC